MEIEVFSDNNDLIDSKDCKYTKYPFEKFNPVQSRVFQFTELKDNLLIASATGSGKTICSELLAAQEIRSNKKKVIYVSPLRSLAQEKYDEWQSKNSHFQDLKIVICTGDYRITNSRIEEINEADIIVMTAEALNSRARNASSNSSQFLKEVGTVILDEVHLLTTSRGGHVESAIMKLVEINKNIRLIMLSATLPNVEDVGKWIATITGRKTNVIKSEYRPVKLTIEFPTYRELKDYESNEQSKINRATKIVHSYPGDKFLCFVHSKRTGENLFQTLSAQNVKCAFHNADLTLKERMEIESEFKNGDLRVMIATSTLAWGVEMPARRVVILGVHSGRREVEWYDILQMVGRAGRPKYDKEGNAYILLPDMSYLKYKQKVITPRNIESQLVDPNILAFHLVNEIHRGVIKDMKDIESWYIKTFAFLQRGYTGVIDCKESISKLEKSGCIKINGNRLETTAVGNAASMFYFDPFDVAALSQNYKKANGKGPLEWAFALSCTPSKRVESINSAESEEIDRWYAEPRVRQTHLLYSYDPKFNGELKSAYVYHKLMNGDYIHSLSLKSMSRVIKEDFSRIIEMMDTLDTMSGNAINKGLWMELKARVIHGVEVKYVPLVSLQGIGKAKAVKLYEAGLTTLEQISKNPNAVVAALKCKKEIAEKISNEAKLLSTLS